jgi:phage shock protein C
MENNETSTIEPPASSSHEHRGSITGGVVLIVLGLLFLANNFIPDFRFGDFWPLIFVALGASMLWKSWRKS